MASMMDCVLYHREMEEQDMDEVRAYMWRTPPAPPEGDGQSCYTFRIWNHDSGEYEWIQMGKTLFLAILKWKRLANMLRRVARKTLAKLHSFEKAADQLFRDYWRKDSKAASSSASPEETRQPAKRSGRSEPYGNSLPTDVDPGSGRPLLPWQIAWEADNRSLAKKREAIASVKGMRCRNPFSAGALLEAIVEADETAQHTRSAAEWLDAGKEETASMEEDPATGEDTLDTLELASARTDSGVHQRLSQELIASSIPNDPEDLLVEEPINIPNERPWREVEPGPPVDNSVWV